MKKEIIQEAKKMEKPKKKLSKRDIKRNEVGQCFANLSVQIAKLIDEEEKKGNVPTTLYVPVWLKGKIEAMKDKEGLILGMKLGDTTILRDFGDDDLVVL